MTDKPDFYKQFVDMFDIDKKQSDVEVRVLAKLAALDIDEFISSAAQAWEAIGQSAMQHVARLMWSQAIGVDNKEFVIRAMVILAYRARAIQLLLERVHDTPDAVNAIEPPDAVVDKTIKFCLDLVKEMNK